MSANLLGIAPRRQHICTEEEFQPPLRGTPPRGAEPTAGSEKSATEVNAEVARRQHGGIGVKYHKPGPGVGYGGREGRQFCYCCIPILPQGNRWRKQNASEWAQWRDIENGQKRAPLAGQNRIRS
ncbi:hypothetical protein TREES_T100009571 [Tupaia chinensis]|uniref:Uncharacterized protein n=1 Tax=Tupaia chinensis TaxID=246437 RepID=L9LG12_TUPCH|nr:hypothetical protein TREES_T100009571 [Tupaia chinensis]